jgi:hypothetical protein
VKSTGQRKTWADRSALGEENEAAITKIKGIIITMAAVMQNE